MCTASEAEKTNVLFQLGRKAQAGGGVQERIASAAQVAQLYTSRKKVYPQSVSGTYRNIKWAVLAVALAIYYFTPFIRWDRGADAPSQAVLIDLPGRRFYFFFIEIWPQEVYYITGLLIIAALTLFLMNAIAGRIWCGYLCPQTVWTDLFLAVERFIEGDRRERMMKDKSPWTAQRATQKALKHIVWLMIAWWTGGAWVLYFADAPSLVRNLATLQAPFVAYMWIGILTFTTYLLAGHAREQVCIYMCPWPRIQAAMTDENALNVTYRLDRGEPRMSVKKAEQLRVAGEPAGDCVDCDQCVAVCPTGVDIRQGPNLACIQCGLCIDACDTVMTKIHRPARLIAFDTDVNIARRLEGKPPVYRLLRARTLLYVGVIAVVASVMLFALLTRSTLGVAAIHDRNPLLVTLSDGSVRNSFTLRLSNKERAERTFLLTIDGTSGIQIEAVGIESRQDGAPLIKVGPDQTREIRIHATLNKAERATLPREVEMRFRLKDLSTGEEARAKEHFFTRLAQ
jgi:cytochrome c oxidase accessory protein FixG